MQNKPNFVTAQITITNVLASSYALHPALRAEKTNPIQTQTNPIRKRQKTDTSPYHTGTYNKTTAVGRPINKPDSNPTTIILINSFRTVVYPQKPASGRIETKPIQTHSGPKDAYFRRSVVIKPIIGYIEGFTAKRNEVCWTQTQMILTQILHPNCVKVPLENKEKEAAITELVDLLDNNGLLTDRNVVLDAVLKRERLRSTGTGAGIAIPHGKCDAVRELVMAIGIAREPIEFDSIDEKPVTLVILLVSPTRQTGPHIQALAAISRVMLNEEFRQKLKNAASPEHVYELINELQDQK
jgi:fructose-specific phosphotransferase system IIA component